MLEKGMYVRCPVDELENPRSFVSGQITDIDEFAEKAKVKFHDPFHFRTYYENIPVTAEFDFNFLKRCSVYHERVVCYKTTRYMVLEKELVEGWFFYTIQSELENVVIKVREDKIVVPFFSGRISPTEQLKSYEFQNPAWYFGRAVVSKTMKILDNSVFGFKELAGCKIFLMPHQLKTVMRCLQGKTCRYMLADEVGMGKTIEAAAVLKVYLLHHANRRVLIAVPKPLMAQWKTELFIKFEIAQGEDINGNYIALVPAEDIAQYANVDWDFIVTDEVHKLLADRDLYDHYHRLSRRTSNILFLSATPVQQKREAYLALLRLILPEKYDKVKVEDFEALVKKQKNIRKSTFLVLQNYDDYTERIDDLTIKEENPRDDEECQDLFDDIVSGLKKVNKIINDNALTDIVSEVNIGSDDYGQIKMQEAFFYICDNYQLEKNIIRNRRRYLASDLPKRSICEITYALDPDKNVYEYATYDAVVNWVVSQRFTEESFEKICIPLLMAFFSSPWAFEAELERQMEQGVFIEDNVWENAQKWLKMENDMLNNLEDVLAEPYQYSSRIISIIDFLDQEVEQQKVVLFTNHEQTFAKYKTMLGAYFGEESLALFHKGMAEDDLELNVYRFQNDGQCFMILCDETGGEGRNLQSADFVIHIDLPWDANAIEQRIGRLDRLGRKQEKDVCSIVIYAEKTLEEEMFHFWNDGLNVFRQSLSGLEIIMDDINISLIKAVSSDFRYGISNAVTDIIESSKKMEKEVREEQHFDTAAYLYASMNQELMRTLKYYSQNENDLFANTMMGWAALAGLRGNVSKNDIVRFDDSSFSVKSAENSQLIPPNWMEYVNKASNSFSRKVREMYETRKGAKPVHNTREIVGSFKRDVAIENDYLHFFAPGDEIFDCIIENAMKSYKGTCAAFAVPSDFEWKGLLFTWVLKPNEKLLLEKEIPLTALRQYKCYLSAEQVSTAVSLPGFSDDDKEKAIKLVEGCGALSVGRIREEVAHLGRRSRKNDFLQIKERYGCANADWFQKSYPKDIWCEFVNKAAKMGKEQAKARFKKGSNLKLAVADINRQLNAELAQARFFGVESDTMEKRREMYDLVIKALKTSRFEMESAAFVWVRKI